MNEIEQSLVRVKEELGRIGRRWSLVGGLAVSARAEPRFTRDIDLAVAVDDDESAEAIVMQLSERGLEVLASLEQEATSRLATVRLGSVRGAVGVVVDLLFASSGIEAEVVEQAELLEIFPQLHVPVARIGHLIALKILSRNDMGRPQDLADLRALVKEASDEELELTRSSLALIGQRGYQRGRDLEGQFEVLLKDLGRH
ncbi:MAG: nucleotidyl transferase AbiEii/AbiGii toxin family protein [Trueperaceae bacterium]